MEKLIVGILLAVCAAGSAVFLAAEKRRDEKFTAKQRNVLKRIFMTSLFMLILQAVPQEFYEGISQASVPWAGRVLRFVLYMAVYYVIGHDILRKALKGIKNRRVFDENFLMAVATVGAVLLAVWSDGDYTEAIAVMLFYQIGEWFQSYAVGRSRRNISELMDIRPDYANVEENGELKRVEPDEVAPGSVIVVKPGEKVPIDGTVIEGESSLDTSALTGESLPRDVKAGDEIISGCISMTGLLRIRTTAEFEESTVSKILELVENASSRKSRSENFISRFARVYTPVVCCSALALAFVPPVVRVLFMETSGEWADWMYRALTFLIISCPCALVISIPLSFFAGIGGAGREGILIKGSNYLEAMSGVKTVVFDKTGTLTEGTFTVSEIHSREMDRDLLLEYAAYAESASSHPISRSIVRAYGKVPDNTRISNIRETGGKGAEAEVDGIKVAAGNEKLMEQLGISAEKYTEPGTVVYVAVDGRLEGYIVIEDTIKRNAAEAVKSLRRYGVEKTVMLTGDGDAVAQKVASEVGIDHVAGRLLPEDKVYEIEKILKESTGKGKVAFAGDGINDAPVLSRADIGIAMGAMGSDAAIEAADVVLMDDDPAKIAEAIGISRKCMRIVYENIVFALGVKFACLLFGAFGQINMYVAIFADVGVMVLAVLNAIRCLFVKRI